MQKLRENKNYFSSFYFFRKTKKQIIFKFLRIKDLHTTITKMLEINIDKKNVPKWL